MPNDKPPTIADVPRLALRPREAADALGLSERAVQSLIADPTSRFPAIRVGAGERGQGRAVLVPVRELTDWLSERAKEGVPE